MQVPASNVEKTLFGFGVVFRFAGLVAGLALMFACTACNDRETPETQSLVARVWTTPAHPADRQPIVFHARIVNKTNDYIPAGTHVRIAFAMDGVDLGRIDATTPAVPPSGMLDVATNGRFPGTSLAAIASPGRHFIVAALADPDGPQSESQVIPHTAASGLLAVGTPRVDRRLRIMPLGDSITAGTKSSTSYRYFLSKSLQDSGLSAFTFVGSLSGLPDGQSAPDNEWEMRHEGHPGWTAQEIIDGAGDRREWASGKLSGPGGWAAVYRPDIVLIDLGLNDLSAGRSPRQAAASLAQVIDALRRANPQVAIAIAQVTPEWNGEPGRRAVPELNDRIAILALQKTTLESPVVAVDLYDDMDLDHDFVDGVHPNDGGHRKLAARWLPAVKALADVVLARKTAPGNTLAVQSDE